MTEATARSAPFSRAVFQAIRKLYPESLADKSWDNTGLLLEAPFHAGRRQKNSVLLTVDLTRAVADEAIKQKNSVVVAYHPIIFKGLKSLTLANTQQNSLLRLAAEGISVYCPHTAFDSAPGGINDWLADVITGTETSRDSSGDKSDPDTRSPEDETSPPFLIAHQPSLASRSSSQTTKLDPIEHKRRPIVPLNNEAQPGAGQGRIVTFDEAQQLSAVLERVRRGLGDPKAFPLAIPQGKRIEDIDIKTVGICAGSGGGLLSPLQDVDLLFTGELSHHEALAAIERGQVVIALFHSNTERGFLHAVLRSQLEAQVREEWEEIRANEQRTTKKSNQEVMDALQDEQVVVEVSVQDRDPYGILFTQSPSK